MSIIRKLIATISIIGISVSVVNAKSPLPEAGNKLVEYGKVEGWTVYHNKTRGDCLIVSSFGLGVVQMGVTASDQHVGYLGIFTKHEFRKRDSSPSKIFISIGGNLYEGVATGKSEHLKGGYSGGYILTNNPEFKRDVATKYEMTVFPETAGAFIVDLSGTYKAMKMARACFKQ